MKEELRGEWIYGRRPVIEVLRSGRRHFHEVVMAETKDRSPELDEIRRLAATCNVFVKSAGREELARYTNEGNHQGVAVRTGGYPYSSIEDVLARIEDEENAIVLVLDHIEDPQNVGSLLRTAEAAGVAGVIIPEDRASGVTASAVRASAGASEHLCIAKVVNIVQAMKQLQKENVWLTGLDMGPQSKPYTEIDFRGKCGIIVGSEGTGLGRLVYETCDFIASLPMLGAIESLNAGVAGGIALFEAVRQQQGRKASKPCK